MADLKNNYWVDTHTHLNMLKKRSASEAIAEAKSHNIQRFLTIGTDSQDHPTVLNLAKEFDEVFCTLGVHPHDAEDFKNARDWMLENLDHAKVVAVGEIGLDFFYDNAPRELQMEVFREQMKIAEKHGLPVQIHTRDAERETAEVLHEFKGRVSGILHCFSSSRWLAEQGLAAGFNISISGIVTFKSAQDLRDTVREVVPLNRIHVETDAPFLAPNPCRGKENHSSYMMHTAAVVAELKGITTEELMMATTQNNMELFTKLK